MHAAPSTSSNATERTPLIARVGRAQPIQRRYRSSTWNLSLPSKRRLIANRAPSKSTKSPSDIESTLTRTCSHQSAGSCHDAPSTSSVICHEESSTPTTLSRTASVDTHEEPISQCHTPNRRRYHLKHLYDNVSLTLENHGSVARDHLASERTFLAYVRTSLALASAGVALVQLYSVATANGIFHKGHRMHVYIRPLGGLTIGFGLMVMGIGITRYFVVQQALTKGYFPVSRIATAFMGVCLITLIVLTFSILIAGKLEPRGL